MDKDKSRLVYCICRTSEANVFMIMCDFCQEWYHGDCIGVTLEDAQNIEDYCCLKCHRRDWNLKSTYKIDGNKNKPATKRKVRNRKKSKTASKKIKGSKKSGVARKWGGCPLIDIVDPAARKAKTDANQKMKLDYVCEAEETRRQEIKSGLVQCYGPECTNPSREGSKYCSDQCGLALARNRIIEILPQRILDYNSPPPTADELCQRNLTDLRREMKHIKNDIAAVDVQIIELMDEISQSKNPENDFAEALSDDVTPMECLLCGAEVQTRAMERHLELCYTRLERKTITTEYTLQPDDAQWNVFCNHEMHKNVYCKKLKVLCPLHYKDHRKDDEVCGHPLQSLVHCGNVGRSCQHVNWEEISRAELDLKKLNQLIKLSLLQKEEQRIRTEMASRGDVLSLMLNQTIAH